MCEEALCSIPKMKRARLRVLLVQAEVLEGLVQQGDVQVGTLGLQWLLVAPQTLELQPGAPHFHPGVHLQILGISLSAQIDEFCSS